MPSTSAGERLRQGRRRVNEQRTHTKHAHADLRKPVISCVFYLLSLHELVKHEENGLIFRDSQELAEQLRVRMLYIKKSQHKHTDESPRAFN